MLLALLFHTALAETPVPLPDTSPGTVSRPARAGRYERRWQRARAWEIVGIAMGAVGTTAVLAGWPMLFEEDCFTCGDGTSTIIGVLAVSYGGLAVLGGAATTLTASLVARPAFESPPPVTGLLISGGGLVVTAAGVAGMIDRGITDPTSTALTLVGPVMMTGGSALQFVLDQGAANKGFVTVLPTPNGFAVAGRF